MFDLTFEMGWIGVGTLAIGSVVVGLAVFFVGAWASRFEWLLDVIAAFAGGFIASEYLGDLGTWGPNCRSAGGFIRTVRRPESRWLRMERRANQVRARRHLPTGAFGDRWRASGGRSALSGDGRDSEAAIGQVPVGTPGTCQFSTSGGAP
jgi:hypothetical protein